MRTYYYEVAGQQAGPVAGEHLLAHGVQAATLVWHEGMADWAPAATLAELTAFFQPVPPPLPLCAAGMDAPVAIKSASPATALINTPATSSPPPEQTAPLPFALGQAPALGGNRPPTSPESPHPQFSAETSTREWWHYVIYAIAVFVMLLLFRACGALVGHILSVAPLATPVWMSPGIAQVRTSHWNYTSTSLSQLPEDRPAGQPHQASFYRNPILHHV